jgi:class 3 adenylate cyclase
VTCSKCSAENAPRAKFCIECGGSFKGRCPECGSANPANAKFCQECGTSFGTTAEPKKPVSDDTAGITITAGRSAGEIPDGERKTVTALLADIKGSTELMRDLDPEEARSIVDHALKLMIDAVHRYDGYVVQSTGDDGFFALFGAPVAHEDHPQRAVHAGLAARDALRSRGESRAAVEIRIGINTSEVVMRSVQTGGHTEYSPVGHVINLASRIQGTASADGVVVSEDTRHLIGGYFRIRGLAPQEVKGVAEPIDVYEVVALGTLRGHFDVAAQRGLTPFVGREHELEDAQPASAPPDHPHELCRSPSTCAADLVPA